MICGTPVNTQTHSFCPVILLAQPAELTSIVGRNVYGLLGSRLVVLNVNSTQMLQFLSRIVTTWTVLRTFECNFFRANLTHCALYARPYSNNNCLKKCTRKGKWYSSSAISDVCLTEPARCGRLWFGGCATSNVRSLDLSGLSHIILHNEKNR